MPPFPAGRQARRARAEHADCRDPPRDAVRPHRAGGPGQARPSFLRRSLPDQPGRPGPAHTGHRRSPPPREPLHRVQRCVPGRALRGGCVPGRASWRGPRCAPGYAHRRGQGAYQDARPAAAGRRKPQAASGSTGPARKPLSSNAIRLGKQGEITLWNTNLQIYIPCDPWDKSNKSHLVIIPARASGVNMTKYALP